MNTLTHIFELPIHFIFFIFPSKKICLERSTESNNVYLVNMYYFLYHIGRDFLRSMYTCTGSPLIVRFLGPQKTVLMEIRTIRGVFMV